MAVVLSARQSGLGVHLIGIRAEAQLLQLLEALRLNVPDEECVDSVLYTQQSMIQHFMAKVTIQYICSMEHWCEERTTIRLRGLSTLKVCISGKNHDIV